MLYPAVVRFKGADAGMAEEFLDAAQVVTRFEHAGGERVPEQGGQSRGPTQRLVSIFFSISLILI